MRKNKIEGYNGSGSLVACPVNLVYFFVYEKVKWDQLQYKDLEYATACFPPMWDCLFTLISCFLLLNWLLIDKRTLPVMWLLNLPRKALCWVTLSTAFWKSIYIMSTASPLSTSLLNCKEIQKIGEEDFPLQKTTSSSPEGLGLLWLIIPILTNASH